MIPPKVSVIMPVHNGARYLREAIDSILQQTYREFELIIIDDGSSDDSATILAEYLRKDPRVRVYMEEHQGLSATLNRGLDVADGEYVARMDADDVSLPERLATQVEFMEEHKTVGVCGSWVETFGDSAGDVWRYPTDSAVLRCRLLFDSPLAHPTVMMRRRTLADHLLRYDSAYMCAQDYDLWERATHACELANIPKVLLLHRRHQAQASQARLDEQLAVASVVQCRQLERLGLGRTSAERELHEAICWCAFEPSSDFLVRAEAWLRALKNANRTRAVYPEPEFSKTLTEQWYRVCRVMAGSGSWVLSRVWRRSSATEFPLTPKQLLILTAKCMLSRARGRTASQ